MKAVAILAALGAATCGPSVSTGPSQAGDPYWCYSLAEREGKPPCQSPEEFGACYLDAEERAEIAHGAPDVRPAWCFDGGHAPLRVTSPN